MRTYIKACSPVELSLITFLIKLQTTLYRSPIPCWSNGGPFTLKINSSKLGFLITIVFLSVNSVQLFCKSSGRHSRRTYIPFSNIIHIWCRLVAKSVKSSVGHPTGLRLSDPIISWRANECFLPDRSHKIYLVLSQPKWLGKGMQASIVVPAFLLQWYDIWERFLSL